MGVYFPFNFTTHPDQRQTRGVQANFIYKQHKHTLSVHWMPLLRPTSCSKSLRTEFAIPLELRTAGSSYRRRRRCRRYDAAKPIYTSRTMNANLIRRITSQTRTLFARASVITSTWRLPKGVQARLHVSISNCFCFHFHSWYFLFSFGQPLASSDEALALIHPIRNFGKLAYPKGICLGVFLSVTSLVLIERFFVSEFLIQLVLEPFSFLFIGTSTKNGN